MPSKDKVAKRYDKWSYVYDRMDTFPGANRSEKKWRLYAIASLKLDGSEKVLDIGTGSGLILPWIAEQLPNGQVVGTDISEKMLKKAGERMALTKYPERASLKVMDSENLDFEEATFDRAIATFALTSFPDPEAAVHSTVKALKKGGLFVVLDTGKPTNPLLRLFFPWMKFLTERFGYTYIGRDIIGMLEASPMLDIVETKRFFGGMVYCVTCKKL